MAFYYLLLGHLIGDFVLQTDKIAENKSTHWKWNLLHVSVVTFCIFIFASSFGKLLSAWILINGFLHFLLDFYKNKICKFLHFSNLSGFLVDQFIHLLILYGISLTAHYPGGPLLDFRSVKLLIMLIMITSFSAVFTQFVLSSLFPREESRFFESGEKQLGIMTRINIFVIFYMAIAHSPYYLLLLTITFPPFILQFKQSWNRWMSLSHLAVKVILDSLIPALCIFLSVKGSILVFPRLF